MWERLHVKYMLLSSDFNETRIFSKYFRKSLKCKYFIKIRPVGYEFFHANRQTDGQTDMKTLIVSFRNFANAPKNAYPNIAYSD